MNPSDISLGGFFDVNRNLFKSVRISYGCYKIQNECHDEFFEIFSINSSLVQWSPISSFSYSSKSVYQKRMVNQTLQQLINKVNFKMW